MIEDGMAGWWFWVVVVLGGGGDKCLATYGGGVRSVLLRRGTFIEV